MDVDMEVASGILGDFLPMILSSIMFAMLKPASIAAIRRGGLGKDEADIHALGDRVVGFVHAIISSVLATYFLTVPTFLLAENGNLCTPMDNGFKRLAQFTSGYFMFDLVMSAGGGWGIAYILHAVFSFICFALPVYTDYGHKYACGFLFFEVSTIPFHMAYFIKAFVEKANKLAGEPDKNAYDHPAVKTFQYIFSITFIAARIFFGFWFSAKFQYQSFYEPLPTCVPAWLHYSVIPMNFIFNGLNTFWASKILKRAFSSGKKAKKTE